MNPIYLDYCFAEIVKTKKEDNDIKTDDPSFYWVPIWLAEIELENKIYYIVMNGQTWEMAGVLETTGETIRKQKKEFYIRRAIKFTGILLSIVILLSILIIVLTSQSFLLVLMFSPFIMSGIIQIFENIKVTISEKIIELVKIKKITKIDSITQNTTKKFRLSPQQNKIRKTRK